MLEAQWEEGFVKLQRFVEREGHADVLKVHREDGFKLGIWVSNKRQMYGQGNLSRDRQHALEAMPGWGWGARR